MAERDEALRSALGRLKVAVFGIEQGAVVRAYNRRAVDLLAQEGLREDVLTSRPSHPLSLYLRELLDSADGTIDTARSVTFPTGRAYRLEASQPSQKGRKRLVMLFVEPMREEARADVVIEAWSFTPREKEVAQQMVLGANSDEICDRLEISHETLKSHLRNMFAKTGTRSRTELVAKILAGPPPQEGEA